MTGPTRRETCAALRALLKSARRIVKLEDQLKRREARRVNQAARDDKPAEGKLHA
jgi:hypothetical protein